MAAWLDERRGEARAAFETTPLPTLKDENWRYTSLRGIDFDAFAPVEGAVDSERATTILGDLETAGELVQRGQDVVSVRLDDDLRAAGVVLSSLDAAVEDARRASSTATSAACSTCATASSPRTRRPGAAARSSTCRRA